MIKIISSYFYKNDDKILIDKNRTKKYKHPTHYFRKIK